MGKKKTYSLTAQEELGAAIDRSIESATPQNEGTTTSPSSPATVVINSTTDASVSSTTEGKKIMKNIWVTQPLDAKIKVLRAYRKAQNLPATFDAIANEALQEYVKNHIAQAVEWGST